MSGLAGDGASTDKVSPATSSILSFLSLDSLVLINFRWFRNAPGEKHYEELITEGENIKRKNGHEMVDYRWLWIYWSKSC